MPGDTRPVRLLVRWMEELLGADHEGVAALQRSVDENPTRIDRAYAELLGGYDSDPAAILKPTAVVDRDSYTGTVSTWQVPFLSFCAHHFLPFTGTVDLHYRPGTIIVGIGKIPRLIVCRARRFQLQEYLVRQLAEDMVTHADASAVLVTATARHMCVCHRGPDRATTVQTMSYSLGEADLLSVVRPYELS